MTSSFLIRAFFCTEHSELLPQPWRRMLRDYNREIDGAASCEVYGCQSIGAAKGFFLSRVEMLAIDYLDRVRFFFFLFPILGLVKREMRAERREELRRRRHNQLSTRRRKPSADSFITQLEEIQQ